MSEVKKYPVLSPVKDAGKPYPAGGQIELTPELAEPLIKARKLGQAIKEATKPAKGGAGA